MATEAQVSRVGQYVRDLQLDPGAVAALLMRVFEIHIEFGDKPWDDIKNTLTAMDGLVIGKLIAELDALYNAAIPGVDDGDGA